MHGHQWLSDEHCIGLRLATCGLPFAAVAMAVNFTNSCCLQRLIPRDLSTTTSTAVQRSVEHALAQLYKRMRLDMHLRKCRSTADLAKDRVHFSLRFVLCVSVHAFTLNIQVTGIWTCFEILACTFSSGTCRCDGMPFCQSVKLFNQGEEGKEYHVSRKTRCRTTPRNTAGGSIWGMSSATVHNQAALPCVSATEIRQTIRKATI